MIGKTVFAGMMALAVAQPALAACPSPAPGALAEEIKSQGERIVCFQRELSEDAERRKLQSDIEQMNRQLQQLQLQRQFDLLPRPEPLFPAPAFP